MIYTVKYLKKSQNYLFNKTSDYSPLFKSNVVNSNFSLGKSKNRINFKSISVKHGKIKSLAYVFNRTAYISDCNDLSIVNLDILKNLNLLILDCLKFDKHPTHFNIQEALYVSNMLNPKKTILTNLHYDLDYDFLISKLPKNVLPAYDGLKINLWKC